MQTQNNTPTPSCEPQVPSSEALKSHLDVLIVEDKTFRRDLDAILQKLKAGVSSRERALAITKLQEAIMWIGQDLGRLNKLSPAPAVLKTAEQLASEAYYRYGAVTDFKNFRGDQMPDFAALPENIRRAWAAAVTVPDVAYPYANSKDPSNTKVDATAEGLKI